MKYPKDTYRLYESEALIATSMCVRIALKEEVDIEALKKAANEAIKRYPYFAVEVSLDEDGAYTLQHNPRPIVVMRKQGKPPLLGSEQTNRHLCFIEVCGKLAYFYLCHSIAGGKTITPWVMSILYYYVEFRYGKTLEGKGIRKAGEPFLPGEIEEPSLEMLTLDPPNPPTPSAKPALMLADYINGLLNPFKRRPNYHVYEFAQSDVIRLAKENNASVVSLFQILIARSLDHVLAKKHKVIGAETSHNPSSDIGLPYSHLDLHSMVYVDFDRERLQGELKDLGAYARSEIKRQADPKYSHAALRPLFETYAKLDEIKGLKEKRAFMKKNSPSRGKSARHSTFVCNYVGQYDWDELSVYVEEYEIVVDGHLVFEITSIGEKIFLSQMQLLATEKYVRALEREFGQVGLSYVHKGPFPKMLPKHLLPKE